MRRKLLISSIILIAIIVIGRASYAAVEIVPSKNGKGTDQIVNTTVSNSFLLCRGMKDTGGSLKGTTVDPHLATNKDWGAVSYLSNSIYGTNTKGANTGVEVTIDGVKYYSTTTNITGVMNWGSNPNTTRHTQTAGLISNYDSSTSSASSNVTELNTYKDTKYVDYINPKKKSLTLGMAIQETTGMNAHYSVGVNNLYPTSVRYGLFGIRFGHNNGGTEASGGAFNTNTFRPVIWNN